MSPIYDRDGITVYWGDSLPMVEQFRGIDAIVTDPPYNETALEWDVWPSGWPHLFSPCSRQLWCFGSMRMFLERIDEFSDYTYAQEIVWEKHNGSSMVSDRFRRVHEFAMHFYRGDWPSLYKAPPVTTVTEERKRATRTEKPAHFNGIGSGKTYTYDGTRIMRSVIPVRSCHGYAVNETQKPEGIIRPLLEYSVPAGGIVLDPFAGSGTTLIEARRQGKRAIGIEKRESQCEEIIRRLGQLELL